MYVERAETNLLTTIQLQGVQTVNTRRRSRKQPTIALRVTGLIYSVSDGYTFQQGLEREAHQIDKKCVNTAT